MRRVQASSALLALLLAGCAHEVKFPASRFNPPETRGKTRVTEPEFESGGLTEAERPPIGRVAPLVIQTGHSVALFPRFTSNGEGPAARDLDYQAPGAGWAFLGELALDDRWDIGLRIQPGAPVVVRAKRLLKGEPSTRPLLRELVYAASAGLGFGLTEASIGTFDMNTGQQRDGNLSHTSFTFDAGVSAGMRLWPHTLVWIEPHARFDSVSAALEFASDTSLNQTASGSGLLWGVSFGSRFEWEKLFLMVELTWARGKFEGMDGVGFFPSVALGADL